MFFCLLNTDFKWIDLILIRINWLIWLLMTCASGSWSCTIGISNIWPTWRFLLNQNTGNKTKRLCNVLFQFLKSSQHTYWTKFRIYNTKIHLYVWVYGHEPFFSSLIGQEVQKKQNSSVKTWEIKNWQCLHSKRGLYMYIQAFPGVMR